VPNKAEVQQASVFFFRQAMHNERILRLVGTLSMTRPLASMAPSANTIAYLMHTTIHLHHPIKSMPIPNKLELPVDSN
jgi:hypothetical protein